MIKNILLILVGVLCAISIFSCTHNAKKDNGSPSENICGKKWYLVKEYYTTNGGNPTDLPVAACDKDNFFSCNCDGTYLSDKGTVMCEDDTTNIRTRNGTWKLDNNVLSISIENTPLRVMKVANLSTDSLTLTVADTSSGKRLDIFLKMAAK